ERATDGPRRGAGAPAGAETVAARGVITAPVAITGAIAVGHGGCGRSGEAVRAEYLARRARWSVSSASCCCEPPTDSASRTTKTCARSRTRRAPPDPRFEIQMAPDTRTHPRLLVELARVTREDPVGRKLLVCPRPAEGRELLHSLALAGVPWAGWEVTSLRKLAHEVVALDAAREAWRIADEFDVHALVDEAIDAVVARGEAGPFATETGAAFRDAIRRSVATLREAGIDSATVRRASRPGDAKMAALAAVLEEVEQRFAARRLMDGPAVLGAAVEALREGRVPFS